ncbi:MAG: hypothetical protein IKC26_03960, partial [Clostridia bacterium]|nr:hypothetical protein [Clostridia bacterium]
QTTLRGLFLFPFSLFGSNRKDIVIRGAKRRIIMIRLERIALVIRAQRGESKKRLSQKLFRKPMAQPLFCYLIPMPR